MSKSWYGKIMPSGNEISLFLKEYCGDIKKYSFVNDIYAWGDYAKNIHSDSLLKDVDILVSTNIFSEDLLAITNDKSVLKMASNNLKENGYDPNAVIFTNEILKPLKYDINHWVLSSDKQILHFGPILPSSTDREEIKFEAEIKAEKFSGIKKEALSKASEENKKIWINLYDNHMNKFLENMPNEWYMTNYKFRTIYSNLVNITKLFKNK
jgi:hypothetical protein